MATLTYAYADQTAVVGPLAEEENPHSWDLCATHRDRISAPVGWELVRVDLPIRITRSFAPVAWLMPKRRAVRTFPSCPMNRGPRSRNRTDTNPVVR